MISRVFVLALAGGVAAATAGAASHLPRNGLIAFTSDRAENFGRSEVYVVRADRKARTNVSRGTTTQDDEDPHPSWSPDGKRLAFSGDSALVLAKADGSSREVLDEGDLREANGAPNWSPDGNDISVVDGGLWLVSTSSRTARRLFNGLFPSEARWSPTGSQLAFTWAETQGNLDDLYVIRRDGSGLRRLARQISCCVSWSPSGRTLAFGGPRGRLFLIDVRTGRRRLLNVGPLHLDGDTETAWSPTGMWIAVAAPAGVYLVSPDGRRRRRIAGARFAEGLPAWSPSGSSLALFAGGDLYTVSLRSHRRRRILRGRCGEYLIRVAWSPDGKHIAFVAQTDEHDQEIFTMREDGSRPRQLTHTCSRSEREPAWSPDGRRIAYVSDFGGAIYRMKADGSGKRRLTRGKNDGSPSWSPKGDKLVISRFSELFTIRSDGTHPKRLTRSKGANFDPAWAPAGGRIAFESTRAGPSPQIYTIRADGSGVTPLTHGPVGAADPAWSPEGSRIAFIRDSDVWTMNADGTNPVRLTRFDGYTEAAHPAWSPDGTRIVFSRDVDGGRGSEYALFVIASTGGEPRALNEGNGNYEDPDWQPVRS